MGLSQFWRMMIKRPGHETKCTLLDMKEDVIRSLGWVMVPMLLQNLAVFADCDHCEDFLRLMCWSHVQHAVNKSSQFKHLRSVDKILAEALLADIETIFVCEANQ